jgi:Uma2 family endonuclease
MGLDTTLAPTALEAWRIHVELPENAERVFELINGEIIEKMPGTSRNSGITFVIGFEAKLHCRTHQLPCFISTGDGTYNINGNVVAPDLVYKTTPLADDYPDPEPPLWAVEVISPNDKAKDIHAKRLVYIQAGILYWEIYPDTQTIDVYAPGQPVKTVTRSGVLDGGAVLPGFILNADNLWGQA